LSHLSILPTVLRDADCLAGTLLSLGLPPLRGGALRDFAGEAVDVVLQVRLPRGETLGWSRQSDGSLALVGDLQRISRSERLQELLSRITRAYAARKALQDAAGVLPDGIVRVGG
jgi:hypothetical protein